MEQIIEPMESWIGEFRPANDPVLNARETLLASPTWKAIAERHNLTVDDFDWLLALVEERRRALDGVKGFNSRTRIIQDYKNRILDRFNADLATRAKEWRSTQDPSLQGAMDYRHANQLINDVLFIEALIDSLL